MFRATLFCLITPLAYAEATKDLVHQGIDFIRQNQPIHDQKNIDEKRISADVQLALEIKEQFSWSRQVPWDIFKNDVLPYAVVNEDRSEWRADFNQKFSPFVKECKSGTEATLAIASIIGETLQVQYSKARNKPHQGIPESLQSGKVSCTGQSILLVCALRSIGIPARMAGIVSWNHVRGNHSWVEAWCDGAWQMIEYNEKSFNTSWVMHNLTMIDEKNPDNRVIATSWEKQSDKTFFPMVWEAQIDPQTRQLFFPDQAKSVPGINVTERYTQLAKNWYEKQPNTLPGSELFIELSTIKGNRYERTVGKAQLISTDGKVIAEGTTPSTTDDMRQFLILKLPKDIHSATLIVTHPESEQPYRQEIIHTGTPVQIIRIKQPSQD